MNSLPILATFAWGGWQGILLKVVVAIIIIWGIQAACAAYQITIPPIVRILAIVLGSILIVYWLFELFNILA